MNRIPGLLSKPCPLTINLVELHLQAQRLVKQVKPSPRWNTSRGRRIMHLVRDMKRNGCSWLAMARAAKKEGLYSMTTADGDIAFTLERNFSPGHYALTPPEKEVA